MRLVERPPHAPLDLDDLERGSHDGTAENSSRLHERLDNALRSDGKCSVVDNLSHRGIANETNFASLCWQDQAVRCRRSFSCISYSPREIGRCGKWVLSKKSLTSIFAFKSSAGSDY